MGIGIRIRKAREKTGMTVILIVKVLVLDWLWSGLSGDLLLMLVVNSDIHDIEGNNGVNDRL